MGTYPGAVFPPPFRCFYYFAMLIQKLKNHRKTTLSLQCPLKKKEYLNLLLRLVNAKLHADMEESIQDDFSDLKKDIMNMMTQKEALAWDAKEKQICDLKKQNEELLLKLAEMSRERER